MHALSKTYVPASADLRRPAWDQIHNCYNPPDRPGPDQAGVRERQRQVLARVRALPKTPDGYGLVHADLHWGNFLVERETGAVALIDFDDCAYGWYIMDIALPWLDMLVVHPQADQTAEAMWFLDYFLHGYRMENDLAPFWVEQLPDCLAWLEISLYLRMAPEYDRDTATGWVKAFMAGRRERIEDGQLMVGWPARIKAERRAA